MPEPFDPQREQRHVLTIVGDYVNDSPKLCPKAGRKAYKRFRVIEPESFDVSQTPLNKREPAAPNRNYATVWPLKDACTSTNKCPLVVYLHGRDEHADTADLDAAREMFKLVGVWGFLRYAERDEICANQLGSVLLFPQILVGESWVADNLDLMSSFVLPLLKSFRGRYDNIDFDRVSIVGYSEGALGALQASLWNPDVFAFALASACALPSWENVTLPDKPKSPSEYASWKLQAIVVTFGHWDEIGTVQDNMKNVSTMMTAFGADKLVDTHYRVYTEANHDHWENAFNQWPSLHDMLWFGSFKGHGLEEITAYQKHNQQSLFHQKETPQIFEQPPVVTKKPLSDSGVLAIADGTCVSKDMPSSADWAKNDTRAEKIMKTWHEIMPKGLVQRDFGNDESHTFQGSCLDKMPEPWDPQREQRHVLTIVGDYVNDSPKLCPKAGRKAYKRFRVIEPESFDMSNTSLNKRAPAAPNRNYATVWPLNDVCTSTNKCPLVVYLHGRDEHAETADLDAAHEQFKLVGVWGFLRYAERDEICAEQLGSVLLFPQILVGESWVADNQDLMQSFVLPLLRNFRERYDNIDFSRISIVGYSE